MSGSGHAAAGLGHAHHGHFGISHATTQLEIATPAAGEPLPIQVNGSEVRH
jgi:hypothetical protein